MANKNNLTINGTSSLKHTLILDLDHSNLEDPKEFEEFGVIDGVLSSNNGVLSSNDGVLSSNDVLSFNDSVLSSDNVLSSNNGVLSSTPINTIIESSNSSNTTNSIYPMFSIPDNKMRENIEITKITEGKTFITHLIAFGDHNNMKKSYYEKFDILMFTNSKIAVNFAITRTSRSFTIRNEDLLQDKIFMIDTRLMKNNMCFYGI